MARVTARAPDGGIVAVHDYAGAELGEDYSLADIVTNFALGRMEGEALVIDRRSLRELETLAHGFSFDYPEGFVEMCLDIARAAASLPGETLRFEADF
ncbi:MAG: hypothetical protein HY059_01265 [Proteobacteria bacterium]|nr:hypothetical protein [Pseudomonadota bacterium]